MQWLQIKKEIKECDVLYIRETNPDADYGNIAALTSLERFPTSNTMYFSSLSQLLTWQVKPNTTSKISFLVFADIVFSSDMLEKSLLENIVVLADEVQFSSVFESLLSAIDLERNIDFNFRQLVTLSRQNSSLSQLAKKISEAYNNHTVVIVNNTLSLIASANCDTRYTQLAADVQRGYVAPEALIEEVIPGVPQTVILTRPSDSFKNYHTTIYANSLIVGYLDIFVDKHEALTELELAYLAPASDLLSHRMQHSDFYLINKSNRSAQLFSSVLSGESISNDWLDERMKSFGYDLRENKRIIIIHTDDIGVPQSTLMNLAMAFKPLFINSVFVIQDQAIVFLLSYSERDILTNELLQKWRDVLTYNNVRIGISSQFQDLCLARKMVAEARAALDSGMLFYPTRRLFLFDELRMHYVANVLLAHTGDENVSMFLSPGTMELLHYDRTSGGQLTYTLYLLLKHPKDIASICNELHIHKNTLYARIKKIHSILKADFASVDVAAQIYLTLLFLKRTWQLYFEIEPGGITGNIKENSDL